MVAKKKVLKRPEVKYTRLDSPESADDMERLRKEFEDRIQSYNWNLSNYIAYGEDWLHNNADMSTAARHTNNIYQKQLVLMCISPLRQGLSSESVIATVGMYAGMCLANKDFKNQVKMSIGQAVSPFVDKLSEYANEHNRSSKTLDKMKAWSDNMVKEAYGGRMPFTPQSAAVQDLAIHQMAFNQMRQPGADIEQIQNDWRQARSTLYAMAQADGIDPADINREVRIIVGRQQMMNERDMGISPETVKGYQYGGAGSCAPVSAMFQETSTFNPDGYNTFHRDYFHKENVLHHDAEGKPYIENEFVWNGEFQYCGDDGKVMRYDGDFTPRPPMSGEQCVGGIETVFNDAYTESRNGDEFYSHMMSLYHSYRGSVIRRADFAYDSPDGNLSQPGAHILAEGEVMRSLYNNAEADGFNMAQLRQCTDNAWTKVCETAFEKHPEWAKTFAEKLSYEVKNNSQYYNSSNGYPWDEFVASTAPEVNVEPDVSDNATHRRYVPFGNYDSEAPDLSKDQRGVKLEQTYPKQLGIEKDDSPEAGIDIS